MPFEIGNQWARSRRLLEDTLRRAAHRSRDQLDRACERLIESASDGATWQERLAAFEIIASRLDGKPRQTLEVTGDQPRELALADVVHAVLAARSASATDAIEVSANSEQHASADASTSPQSALTLNDSQPE